jgi:hypothetical protein
VRYRRNTDERYREVYRQAAAGDLDAQQKLYDMRRRRMGERQQTEWPPVPAHMPLVRKLGLEDVDLERPGAQIDWDGSTACVNLGEVPGMRGLYDNIYVYATADGIVVGSSCRDGVGTQSWSGPWEIRGRDVDFRSYWKPGPGGWRQTKLEVRLADGPNPWKWKAPSRAHRKFIEDRILHVVQGFTSDPERLRAALAAVLIEVDHGIWHSEDAIRRAEANIREGRRALAELTMEEISYEDWPHGTPYVPPRKAKRKAKKKRTTRRGVRSRRNPDERMRRIEREVAAGDVSAAEAYLFKRAQEGTWFLPRDWASSGFFNPNRINENRAYWVRLLGNLRWPGAAELQETVAGQAHARREHTHEYTDHLGRPSTYTTMDSLKAMHLLRTVKPFTTIGPKTADGIGLELMEALAGAAVSTTFPLTGFDHGFLEGAAAAVRELKRAGAGHEARKSAGVPGPESWKILREESAAPSVELSRLSTALMPERGAGFQGARVAARVNAREAYYEFFGRFGHSRHDRPRLWSGAWDSASYAMAWACEARRGGDEGPGLVITGDFGMSRRAPRRGCVIEGNREIRKAVLPTVLLAIAAQLMEYR